MLAGINKSGCGTELDVLVVLTAELLCLVQNIAASATRTRHARHQMWVTESGVLWAKGCSIRVIKNLVFTFTSRRCRRQGPGDRLLARPGCAWSGSSLLLVLRLLCDGLEVRDFGLRGGGCVVALQPCLHVFDALLERLEFRGPALNDLLSVVGENGQVSFCALCSPDRRGETVSAAGRGRRNRWHKVQEVVMGVGKGVTHRSSILASRSATLSSRRKMSANSAEKERAMVLESFIVSHLSGESGLESRCAMAAGWQRDGRAKRNVRLGSAAIGLPVPVEGLI